MPLSLWHLRIDVSDHALVFLFSNDCLGVFPRNDGLRILSIRGLIGHRQHVQEETPAYSALPPMRPSTYLCRR